MSEESDDRKKESEIIATDGDNSFDHENSERPTNFPEFNNEVIIATILLIVTIYLSFLYMENIGDDFPLDEEGRFSETPVDEEPEGSNPIIQCTKDYEGWLKWQDRNTVKVYDLRIDGVEIEHPFFFKHDQNPIRVTFSIQNNNYLLQIFENIKRNELIDQLNGLLPEDNLQVFTRKDETYIFDENTESIVIQISTEGSEEITKIDFSSGERLVLSDAGYIVVLVP